MFYDGNNAWKFRYLPRFKGIHALSTFSKLSELGGLTGTLMVTPNLNPERARGFLMKSPKNPANGNSQEKFYWMGTREPFIPQLVMFNHNLNDNPKLIHEKPSIVDQKIQEFMVESGFNGFHFAAVCSRWFDINFASPRPTTSHKYPDFRTFQALELLINKTYTAGGLVHIWMWADEKAATPKYLSGGYDGTVDRRLQNYIAARLGQVPGWSMSYGYDLHEYIKNNEWRLKAWYDRLRGQIGGPWHMISGRGDHNKLTQWIEDLDYSSYQWWEPEYDDYVDHITKRPQKPTISEDRFRVRTGYSQKDYILPQVIEGLWDSVMAGGVGNIWGYLLGDNITSKSFPSAYKLMIKAYGRFWDDNQRFMVDMVRADNFVGTGGHCLRRPNDSYYVFYQKSTDAIWVDLSKMNGPSRAIAVDTKTGYVERDLGVLQNKAQTINLSRWGTSNWAIAVGSQPPKLYDAYVTPDPFPGNTTLSIVAQVGDPNGLSDIAQVAVLIIDPNSKAIGIAALANMGGGQYGLVLPNMPKIPAGKWYLITAVIDRSGNYDFLIFSFAALN